MTARRWVVAEVLGLTAVVLLLIRGVVAVGTGVLYDLPLALVPVLFMWAPVWMLRRRGLDPDAYPLALPGFSGSDGREWVSALRLAGVAVLVVGPPFLLGYHVWHTWLLPRALVWGCDLGLPICRLSIVAQQTAPAWRWPSQPVQLVAYHLLFVAIPEELYYRGYVQSRLDEVWAPRWRVLGATVGPGLLVSSVIFALGHSVVAFQWWHVSIVFPSLVFGWMRARTGSVLAGAFFHAWSNVAVGTLDVVYGLQPP